MQYQERITGIRERARRIGLPMRDVLAAANINPSTLMRWERPDANPRLRTMQKALDRMEAHLGERESRLVAEITEGRPA